MGNSFLSRALLVPTIVVVRGPFIAIGAPVAGADLQPNGLTTVKWMNEMELQHAGQSSAQIIAG